MPTNTTRIAKNTLMLYFRQIFIMLVSLYTVRVVLDVLGAEDYGIYNVVAGMVAMFGLLSNSMSMASQRYFAFEIGLGNFENLKKIFNLNLLIYILIAVIGLLFAETVGLWFISNKLTIISERKIAAVRVYHFSVVSCLFTILRIPYMAMIIAHEEMGIYTYVSIADAVLKLAVVFFVQFGMSDKLQLYGFLMCCITAINTIIYMIICYKYQKCNFDFYWNKNLFRETIVYSGYNLYGEIANFSRNYFINVLLNQFFDPIVVSARGIALSIKYAVLNFSNSFSAALRPQIIKTYAVNRIDEMFKLAFLGSKVMFFLLYIFILPLILEAPIVLSIWLKSTPDNAVLFVRLVLIDVLIDASNPIASVARATGKIRLYGLTAGTIRLLNLPLSWMLLMIGKPAYSVFIVSIFFSTIGYIANLLVLKRLVKYSIMEYLLTVIFPFFLVVMVSGVLSLIFHIIIKRSLLRLFLVTFISFIFTCGSMYVLGFNKTEKKKINKIILYKLRKFLVYTGAK
jgi:O-antigen/teichoic acid export membrane protein